MHCGGSHFSVVERGTIRIEVRFSEALPRTDGKLCVYSESESVLQIVRTRMVVVVT